MRKSHKVIIAVAIFFLLSRIYLPALGGVLGAVFLTTIGALGFVLFYKTLRGIVNIVYFIEDSITGRKRK